MKGKCITEKGNARKRKAGETGAEAPLEGYFSSLSQAIEEAGFNVEMRKRVLDSQLALVPMMEDFLSCEAGFFAVSEMTYGAPLSYIYMANLRGYVTSRYRDRSPQVVAKMRGAIRRNYGLDSELTTFGMRQGKFLPMGDGTVREMVKGGYMFLEDGNGTRMAVKCEHARAPMSGNENITIRFYYDGREDFAAKAADFLNGLERYCRENPVYRRGVVSMNGRMIKIEHTPWEALKLSGEAMRLIDFHIVDFIRRMKEFEGKGARTSRGVILCGPPGNGKTLLGRILATNLDVPFIWVTAKDIDSANAVEALYDFAAFIAPCVVFIEDADLFLQDRGKMAGPFSLTMSEFLNRLDGLKENRGVVTIITANRPEFMDEAVKNRPRRFDARIVFAGPDEGQRRAILQYRLRDVAVDGGELLDLVASRLEGNSCSHVSEFAERLKLAMVYNGREAIDREIVEAELEGFETPEDRRQAGFIMAS